MLPIAWGASVLHIPTILGRDVLSRTTYGMAVSLCKPYKGSKRYKQMVEYYHWKLEQRYSRNLTYRSWAFCHDTVVWWTVMIQVLRLLQLAEVLFTNRFK